MTKFCSFCSAANNEEDLKLIKDIELNASYKLKEAFKVDIDLLQLLLICRDCEVKLDVSWKFYNQVIKAQEVQLLCIIKEEILEDSNEENVKIEEFEVKESRNFGDPLNASNHQTLFIELNGVSLKQELGNLQHVELPSDDFLERWMNLNDSESTKKRRKLHKPASKPKKKAAAKLEDIQKPQPILAISMLDIFSDEINNRKFFEEIKTLQNLEENPKLWNEYNWSCSECQAPFNNAIEMNKHLSKFHPRKAYQGVCKHCQKETRSFASCLNHIIEDHHKNLKFCCIICSEYKNSLMELYEHHHAEHKHLKISFCLYCGLHFMYGCMLRNHMMAKHNRVEDLDFFECDLCGEKKKSRSDIYQHMLKHKPRDIPCSQCSKVFRHSLELKEHINNNHKALDQWIVCSECGKKFPNVVRYNRHYKENHSDESFVCEVCQKVFKSAYKLRNHLACHSEVGKFDCPKCGKNYKHKTGLDYHIRRDHTGERPYSCPFCPYTAVDWPNARKHIKVVHRSNEAPLKTSNEIC